MAEESLPELSARALLAGFARGRFTPSALLEACLERITRFNPAINALTAFCTERAVDEAAGATRRWKEGTPLGPLDGLPVGIKDLQDAEGLPTTHGSPLFRSNVARQDQAIVARLRRAGAVVLAKTNVPELGAGGNTRNAVWGATGNPFDPRLLAGGSSGGSAAALATSLLPLCTGSDTGGSLRLPAALCGVVGFRPSADVVAHPSRPLGWSAISVLGPMARTVDDTILMLQAICGLDSRDPLAGETPPGRFDRLPAADLGRLRLGVSEDFGGAPVDPGVREAFRARVEALAPQVASCRPVDLNLGEMDRAFDILRAESFIAAFDPLGEADLENYGPQVSANVTFGRTLGFRDRAWAHLEQTRILRRFDAVMADLDAILLPTSCVSPFPWSDSHPLRVEGQDMDIYYRWLALTYRGSLMGGPSITLPAGLDAAGLPFGLQMLGPLRGDTGLLAAARSVEAFFAADPRFARPLPDLAALVPPPVDLKSIVTAPPRPEVTAPEVTSAGAATTAV